MQLDSKGWNDRWPSKMVGFREKIPKSHRARFRRFLEWLASDGMVNPGASNLRTDLLERYAATLRGQKIGTQGAYLIGAVCGAQIVAPWLNLGPLRRRAQDLVNAGVAYQKKGRSKTQGTQATLSLPVDQWPTTHRQAWESAVARMKDICGENSDDPFGHYANPDKLPAFSKNAGTRQNHAHAWGR